MTPEAIVPRYMSEGAAGLDLSAAIQTEILLGPGERIAVPTGLALALPKGYEGQVRPRSGLALKLGLTVANAPGTIDSDYRGEIKVILVNLGVKPVSIGRGQRIAQLVIAPIVQVKLREAEQLAGTKRGDGGFGSTGTGR